jgi:hypothetical protein
MDYQQSSKKMWYIIGIIIIAALAFWYFSSTSPAPGIESSTIVEQAQTVPQDTTTDISADLNQIPDDTAELDQAQSASAATVQGL